MKKRYLFCSILVGLCIAPMLVYAQPSLVKDIRPGSIGSFPYEIININGTLFFGAYDGVHGGELWKSDGTEAGTVLVKDIWPGSTTSFPHDLTNVNGTLFFSATDDTGLEELWKSDGTEVGTVRVTKESIGALNNITNVNGTLFFSAYVGTIGFELWKSDGTEAGTVLVKDIRPGENSSSPDHLTNVNGTLFFSATDDTGRKLWKSDGTEAGTELVYNRSPSQFTYVNGTLFFSSGELWKTDGTAAGTVLVKDIRPVGISAPNFLTNVNGTLFFVANFPRELWKSDGTEAGTVPVNIVNNKVSFDHTANLFAVENILYFTATSGSEGVELWRTDGTDEGTFLVADINPGPGSSEPSEFENIGSTLYFQANSGRGVLDIELWKFEGDMQKQYVLNFTLVNADTDKDITVLPGGQLDINELPNAKFNIRANTVPPTVGSVFLQLSGAATASRTENTAPYALFGDNNGNYNGQNLGLGEYTITATPYTKANLKGEKGISLTLNFSITEQTVESFTLVNADTDTDILELTQGMELNLNELPNAKLNIRANTNPPTVGSVFLQLSGAVNASQKEDVAPYALFGDNRGNYYGQNLGVGDYIITATPYTKANLRGGKGTGLTLNFSIVDNLNARISSDAQWGYETGEERLLPLPQKSWVYPNPFTQTFTVELSDFSGENVEVHLYDLYGKPLMTKNIATTSGAIEVDVERTPMGAGPYLLKVVWGDRVEVIKLIRKN